MSGSTVLKTHLPKVDSESASLAGTRVFGGLHASPEGISIIRNGMTSLSETRNPVGI